MNFLSRIFKKAKNKSVSFFKGGSFSGTEDIFDVQNLRAFKDSLYLFIGVSMIRDTVSTIPLEMYKILNTNGDIEEVSDDPLLDLLNRPNIRQTQMEFWKLAVSYYLLAGETFWLLMREGRSPLPHSMVNMRPDHVEILLSKDRGEIVGYEFYAANGETIKLAPEDVLHIKNIDPTNPLRGVGVVRPATSRIVTELEASKHQAETFRTQGRPDVVVFTDVDELTEEAAEEARDKWGKVYGKDKGSQAAFFGAEVKDLKVLSTNPKEMDFIKSQESLRDSILAALRIPKQMVDTDVNYNNSKTAYSIFIRQACLPVLDAFLDILNNKYLIDMNDDRFVTYESPVQEDRELLLKESVELKKAGIITVNEARELMNYEEVEGGDVISESTSFGLQLMMKMKRLKSEARKHLKRRTLVHKKFKAMEAVVKAVTVSLDESTNPKRERNSVFKTHEAKQAYAKAYNENVDRKSATFKDHLDVYNDGFYKRIVKYMEEYGANADAPVFNVQDEIRTAKGIFVPMMKNMYGRIGQETLDMVANGFVTTKASEHFFTMDYMDQLIENRAEFFITSMLDTDWKEMKAIILQGLTEGNSVQQIAQMLRFWFDDMSVKRSKMIARTETGRLVSQATQDAYSQSEVVTGKEWITVGDADVRNEHRANESQGALDKGEAFSNGEHFPGELSVNCRCALAPTV